MIDVDGLTYRYPRVATPALADVDLHIPNGQFCAVVGANGAGKSTLAYALTGFIPHFFRGQLAGRIVVANHSVPQTALADLSVVSSLVFANPFNQISGARYTVREEVAFGLENLGVPRAEMSDRVDAALDVVGLTGLDERSPYELSGGQQQRLALAAVLVMDAPVLVLDEPTSQLDPIGARELFAAVDSLTGQGGKTVVMMSHKLEWLAVHADRLVVLAGGRLVADGPPRDILADPRLPDWGVAPTRYTAAARQARDAGLVPPARPLPVTLEQAVAYFR